MVNVLEQINLSVLQKYRLQMELDQTFQVADLLDKPYLTDFLNRLAKTIGAPSEKTAASIFIKRYAFLAVISLYAMTIWNKKIDVSLDNIEMEIPEQGKAWLPMISLKNQQVEEWDGQNREEWRKEVLQDLFSNNIYPLIVHLEKAFNISKLILWENIAVYLFWLYESELKEQDSPYVKSDFQSLIKEAEGRLFGRYNLNPISKYYTEKRYVEEAKELVRVRKTCCFTYQLSSSPKRCKTCPCTHIAKEGRCQDGESVCSAVQCFN